MAASIGPRLRAARCARGMSARRLALWLGRRHDMVSRWEHGLREPTLLDLDVIARVLRADLDELLNGLPAAGRRGCSSRAHGRSARVALGRVLGRLRAENGLGAWEVLAVTGIPGRELARLEHGADPSLGQLVALARLYGVSPSALLRDAKAERRRMLDSAGVLPMVRGSRRAWPPDRDGPGA